MRRAIMLRKVIAAVIRRPDTRLDVETVQQLAEVDADIARRILQRLTCSGLIRPVGDNVWAVNAVHARSTKEPVRR